MSLLLDALKRSQQERETKLRELATQQTVPDNGQPSVSVAATELAIEPLQPSAQSDESPSTPDAKRIATATLDQRARGASASRQTESQRRSGPLQDAALNRGSDAARLISARRLMIGAGVCALVLVSYFGYQYWNIITPKRSAMTTTVAQAPPRPNAAPISSGLPNASLPAALASAAEVSSSTECVKAGEDVVCLPKWDPDFTPSGRYAQQRPISLEAPTVKPPRVAALVKPVERPRVEPTPPKLQLQLVQSSGTATRSNSEVATQSARTGYEAIATGDFARAIDQYRNAVAVDPLNTSYLLGLAYAYNAIKQDEAAATAYKRVLAIDPDHRGAQQALASLEGNGRSKEAIGARSEATIKAELGSKIRVRSSQETATLWDELGGTLAALRRWEEAQQAYFEAARLAPANARILFNLATSLDQLGQRKAAADYYARALTASEGSNAPFDINAVKARLTALQ
jgi:tetratricopeptide (TPR) repeat protein